MRHLHQCGADYVTVFQETYNSDKYETLHRAGHKRIFPYRLNAQERALKGGMRGVINDFQEKECFGNRISCYLLQISHFRVRDCVRLSTMIRSNPKDVHEPQLLQVITAYRIFMPFAKHYDLNKECERVRNNVIRIAATKISAGVSVGIGEHIEGNDNVGDAQFEISDGRNVKEVFEAIESEDLQPVMSDYIYV